MPVRLAAPGMEMGMSYSLLRILARATLMSATLLSPAGTVFAAEGATVLNIEEIIVTASRTNQPLKSVGSAIDVLTADDIATRPRFEVSDLLRQIPGVAVNRSGQLGAQTQVRLRGAEANHTLVLINGIEVGDPVTGGEFDFANLLLEDVERIEVLRGPQSVLYGAQAIGGVINIITTQGQGAPVYKASVQGGSFGTYNISASANSGGQGYGFAGSVAYLDSAGVSQAIGGVEKDRHHNLTLNTSARASLSYIIKVDLALRYVKAFVESDSQDFAFGSPTEGLVIDSSDTRKSETFYGKATSRLMLFDGAWEHIAAAALTDVTTRNFSGGGFSFGSYGRKIDLSYQTNLTLPPEESLLGHTLTGYVQLKDETFENKSGFPGPQNQRKSTQDVGYVAEYRLDIAGQVFLSGALRYDDNDLFKNEATYRASVAWNVPETGLKVRASYGTGFAKPGFFELFGFDPTSFVGNPNLNPEKSKGWDVGADLVFDDRRASLSLTYFSADLTDEIFTDFGVFPFTVRNQAGKSTREGVEISARYAPTANLNFAASYTYTSAKDDAGLQEVRRPKHVASASGFYRFMGGRANVGLSLDYNGKSQDVVFTPTIPTGVTTLDDYVLATASASYDVAERLQLFGRIENLLDERYQEVFSYNTMGLGAYAGLRIRLGG
jgi:vitamin B12 transporter